MSKLTPINPEEVARGLKPKYKLEDVWPIAQEVVGQLRPHCFRAEIGGSIRRGKNDVSDIEIILRPRPYEIGLLECGIATVINKWKCLKKKLHPDDTKYTQRLHPSGIKLDLFFANETNFGYIFFLRTGSVNYTIRTISYLKKEGFEAIGGYLTRDDKIIPTPSETDFYQAIGRKWVEPRLRK